MGKQNIIPSRHLQGPVLTHMRKVAYGGGILSTTRDIKAEESIYAKAVEKRKRKASKRLKELDVL